MHRGHQPPSDDLLDPFLDKKEKEKEKKFGFHTEI